MELSELVELLYTARERFTTIQVAWQYWYQPDKMNIITERWAASKPSGSVAVLKSKSTSETESSVISRYFRRVWWQKPDCWRDEDQREERSEEHTSELQSRENLVCRLLLEKKKIR